MPGHPVPSPYRWNDSFKVFYESLDAEHKGLFDALFEVDDHKDSAANLDNLKKLIKAHFDHEEEMMKSANYADYAPHKKIHDEFVAKLGGACAPVDSGTCDWAMGWLVNHIKDIDFKYKEKL